MMGPLQLTSLTPVLHDQPILKKGLTRNPTSSSLSHGDTPPLQPLARVLKSSTKKRGPKRNSAVSLFDAEACSPTLPTNFARKGSLPQDSLAAALSGSGLSTLFASKALYPSSKPSTLTLAEFRLQDIYPKRQQRLLTVLHQIDGRLRKEGVVRKLSKDQLKGKPDKEILKPDRKTLNKEYVKKGGQNGFMGQRIPGFLRPKKTKKRTRTVVLHDIEMAIRDNKPDLALQHLSLLPPSALKKKKKRSLSDINHCMLLAMIFRMEQVAVEFVERGFPSDVNCPILQRARQDQRGKAGSFEYPSYFIVAVGLGMGHLIRAMIKGANLNQSWYGLTPLLLATTLEKSTNAVSPPPTLPPAKLARMLSLGHRLHLDHASQTLMSQLPSSFNKTTLSDTSPIPTRAPLSTMNIVAILLEHGADPNQGIPLQQYLWAHKLKGMGCRTDRPRQKATEGTEDERKVRNPMEHPMEARRRESGRQWQSKEEFRARKATRALARQSTEGKKRFSTELQEFWKNKSILPVELAMASGNMDCAWIILQRLGPTSLKMSFFALLLQNDVMLTLSLIKSGCPVSQEDRHGCTPLHLAARRGDLEMVMVLLQLGGDVNGGGERQWTPLHESISQDHADISSLLIACGAQVEAKNDAGETPEETGRRKGLSLSSLAEHLDVTRAKNCSAGLAHTLSASIAHHAATSPPPLSARSETSSRSSSFEPLSVSALRSLIMPTQEDSSRTSFDLSKRTLGRSGSPSPTSMILPSSLIKGASNSTSGGKSPPSTVSSPTASRSTTSEKKQKVRVFLKSIFT